MGFVNNDIAWGEISLYGFMNGWAPGVFTFLLGLWLSKISDRRKLRQKFKVDILGVFIPVFNSGEEITIAVAEDACQRMRLTFNFYKKVYPKIFNSNAEQELSELLDEGFFVNNEINKKFFNVDSIQELIKRL